MNINELAESKYLKKEDVVTPAIVTIVSCAKENMAMENEQPEYKLVVMFKEQAKGLACNITNARVIAALLGSEETNEWTGSKIVLYNDATVMYKGKVTGGIRVRAIQSQQGFNDAVQRGVDDLPAVEDDNPPDFGEPQPTEDEIPY